MAAVKATPAAQAVSQSASRGVAATKNFVTQPGIAAGARNKIWNGSAWVANTGAARGIAKYAPVTVAGGMLPNNELQNPQAPAPAPMQNNGGLIDFMSEAIASGGVPQ